MKNHSKPTYSLYFREKENQGLSSSISLANVVIDGLEYLVYIIELNKLNFDRKSISSNLITTHGVVSGINLSKYYRPDNPPEEITQNPSYKYSKVRVAKLFERFTNYNFTRNSSFIYFVVPAKDFGAMRNKDRLISYTVDIKGKEYTFKFDQTESLLAYDLINMLPCTFNCLADIEKSD